jgi:hypothetical protein
MLNEINPKFTLRDALLLYSVAYCQRHNENATLGRILLTTDAINRECPMANMLEEGFSRLIVGGYIDYQGEIFTVTKSGLHLFNDVTKPRNPKMKALDQIRLLADTLNKSPIKHAEKKLTITSDDYSKAMQEMRVIFAEISKKADEIANARRAKE